MNKLYKDFPIFSQSVHGMPICYLDSASTSQKPQAVIDAVVKTYSTFNANPGRAVYELAEQATMQYENARKKVAQFLNADPREIIFVRGATEGINTIATGWGNHHLKAGDEIVLSELEHHSNLVPWQRVAQQTGATLKFIPITKAGLLDYDVISTIISKRTKLVAITHSSNAIGTSVNLSPIIESARRVHARVLVDACQSAPHEPIDVKKIGADFLSFSGHKMLGPTGSGVLYINAARFDEVAPLTLGGGDVLEVRWHDAVLRQAPEKFEAGTASLAQAVGLATAIEYLQHKVPFDRLREHEAALCAQLIDGLAKYKKITILGPIDELKNRGHLVSFVVDGIHAHDVATFLDQTEGVCVRAGNFCAQPLINKLGYQAAIRASFYCYSTAQDVARLLHGISKLV
jgi:cysteine desulfurase/selenocysteine lyase